MPCVARVARSTPRAAAANGDAPQREKKYDFDGSRTSMAANCVPDKDVKSKAPADDAHLQDVVSVGACCPSPSAPASTSEPASSSAASVRI